MSQDEHAFDEFVRARLPHLLRFGRAMTCNDEAASALVAESLAPVLARWDDDSELTAEDDVRRAMVGRFLRHNGIRRGTDDPGTERDQPVWEALTDLSPKQRALVALRCHEELSEGQVADVMRCSTGTVRGLAGQAMDGLDEARLRRTLEEPVVVDERRLIDTVRYGADRRRRRRNLLVAGGVATLLAGVTTLGVLAATRPPDEPPPGLPDIAVALAVSDADHVWAVTEDPRCSTCSTLWAGDGTADGWTKQHAFERPPYVAQLEMASNGKDGWAWFGRDWLQATHDGGKTWVIPGVDLREANVDVQVAGMTVWALLDSSDDRHLWRSQVGTDDWEEVPLTAEPADHYALAALGDQMFVVEYLFDGGTALRPATGPGGEHPVPCSSLPLPPRSSPGAMWVTCPDEGSGVAVKRSSDGVTWEEVGLSPSTRVGSYPVSDDQTLVMTSAAGRLVGDQGRTDVLLGLEERETVDDGVFTSPLTGFLLTSAGRVLRTDDGARSWQEIG